MRFKHLDSFLGMCAMALLVACAPMTDVNKIGSEYVQNAYSRNYWWPNWQRVTYCWKLDANGFCPKEDTRVEVVTQIAMESAGQKAAIGAVSQTPMALGLGLGLSHMQAARMTQSVTANGFGTGYISPLSGYKLPWQQFP